MTTVETLKRSESFIMAGVAKVYRWGSPLWKILSFSIADDRIAPKQCLSVQLKPGGVYVVYGSRFFSRMKIRDMRHYPFEKGKYPTPENLASAIALAINDLKAERAQVLLVVPKAWAILQTADFPITVKDNISNVVAFELDRLTPLSPEKAFYDFRVILEEESRLQIMLAAMSSERLQPYVDALQERGITIKRVVVGLPALGTLSHYVQGKGNTGFLDIHADGYEGGLIRDGKLTNTFTGNLAAGNEQEKINIIIGEINTILDAIKEGGGIPSEVFIDCSSSGKWRVVLPDMINAPVRFFGEMDLKLRFLKTRNKEEIPHTALGGVLESLWPGAQGMNLLDRGIHKPVKTPLAATIILMFIIAALGLFWLVSPIQIEEKRIAGIDREISARKDEVKKIEALKKDLEGVEKEVSTIRDFKANRPVVLNLMKEMTRALPKNTWLSRMRVTESTVEIEGYASSATDILPKLEASPFFKKVEFASPTFRDTRLNSDRFIIKMEIEGLPEEKARNEKKE